MITGQVIKGKNTAAFLKQVMPALNSAVELAVVRMAIKVQAMAKMKLSGEVLKVRTGRLRRSITFAIEKQTNRVDAIVGTNVKYAAIHEYGGTIPAKVIMPVKANALKFQMNGKTVFSKRAMIPAIKMPMRSFLRSSLNALAPEIRSEIDRAIKIEFEKMPKS